MNHVDCCPTCGVRSQVTYTRNNFKGPSGDVIRRLRQCPVCGKKYGTFELLEDDYNVYLEGKQIINDLRVKLLEVIDESALNS